MSQTSHYKPLLLAGVIGTAMFVLLVWRLADHDFGRRASEPFGFAVAGDHVAGTVWLQDASAKAAVVLVHGDGPQDRRASGGYAPLINWSLDAGIAVASWDKARIGMSGGNWLDQSMSDRAAEARQA